MSSNSFEGIAQGVLNSVLSLFRFDNVLASRKRKREHVVEEEEIIIDSSGSSTDDRDSAEDDKKVNGVSSSAYHSGNILSNGNDGRINNNEPSPQRKRARQFLEDDASVSSLDSSDASTADGSAFSEVYSYTSCQVSSSSTSSQSYGDYGDGNGDDYSRSTTQSVASSSGSQSDSESESDSTIEYRRKQRKRQRVVVEFKNNPNKPLFPVGHEVRKHFPSEGWFDGRVISVQWSAVFKSFTYTVEYDQRKDKELLDDNLLKDITIPTSRRVDPTVYSFLEFLDIWEQLEPEAVEKSDAVRRANTRISNEDSGTQVNAQYGRVLPIATDRIFQILQLKRRDVFLDIGSGIGNTCLQAAYCTGCESRGIEIVKDRFNVSVEFVRIVKRLTARLDRASGRPRVPGEVILSHGDLTDSAKHNWLVKANKVFVNNFNGVFAERMVTQSTKWHLDHYIAGLFASMEEESLMITLSDLQLGPTQNDVNKWREDNGLEPSVNASFFDVVKVRLGEANEVFSWSCSSKDPAYAYVYRRVKQDPELRTASTMCCNINCEHSTKGTPIPAVAFNREGKAVVGTCECKMTMRSNRRVPLISLEDFLTEYSEWGR